MTESRDKSSLFFIKLKIVVTACLSRLCGPAAGPETPKALVPRSLEMHVATHQKNISDCNIT